MSTIQEVKDFLKIALPEARRKGVGKLGLAAFLHQFGISIKGVDINLHDGKSYLSIEFINDENQIEDAKFLLTEVDGRTEEEIAKDMGK